MPIEEVTKLLETSSKGLTKEEVLRRREIYGPNKIEEVKKLSAPRLFLRQFQNALNYILALAAAISIIGDHIIDAIVIIIIIFINATLGFVQEYRSEKALEALKQFAAPKTTVIRDNRERKVNTEDLVPGDIVVLTTGDIVPADMRLLTLARLRAEQAILTGEPGSEEKLTGELPEDTPLVDRRNMAYSGTTITGGRGSGIVVAIGMNTEMGKIAQEISEAGEEKTPLQKRITNLAVYLAILAVILATGLGLLAFLKGIAIYDALMFALAASISAIPEGLIAVITLVLVVGVRTMAKRNAIIRKLQAVETLGSATVICTDKTGTLTKNEMMARALYLNGEIIEITGEGYAPVGDFRKDGAVINPKEHPHLQLFLRAMALCNDAHLVSEDGRHSIFGDPTEGALVVAAAKGGIDKEKEEKETPRVDEIPFESERACMATVHQLTDQERYIYVKGAPERMVQLCNEIYINGEFVELTDELRNQVLEAGHELAATGYRVLGGAYRVVEDSKYRLVPDECGEDLVFLGLVGIVDPPRKEVIEAVAKCKSAGIRVVMITGDHRETARAIAEEVGIITKKELILEGRELDKISDEQFEKIVESVRVFARTEPRHKLRIVKALKARGQIVAMTGDGVNDAPALKEADVGIAMSITGTQITKETSDMVLTDDNFASIVAAVEEGRTTFDNLRKVVTYLLTTNIAEMMVLFSALVLGFPLPFLPLQILWINLVTDGICDKTLAVEPRDRDVLKEPPRPPKERIVTRGVVYLLIFLATIMAIGTLFVYHFSIQSLGPWVFIYGYKEPRSMTFFTIIFFQLFNALNARSREYSVFKIGFFSNKYLIIGLVISFVLNISIGYIPFFQDLFQIMPLPLHGWFVVFLVSSSALILEEIRKAVAPKLFSR
ncbi:MAG: cation-translocating P-type ATPase [Candidatus Jordarchaeum sp.]|uniref:cation-translocating P-type ATPase n=1 Tax=Candidatus Jordarchaeum sp. TaxID=2823881 RepID=UPI00404B9FB8